MDEPRIYRYVVRYDTGTAPRTCPHWCTLAVCKPQIRATARPGDWILGLRRVRNDELTYAMRVSEVLPLGEYWSDPRFASRRPGASATPDNFYRSVDGVLRQVRNRTHGPEEAAKDIRGRNALVSDEFWYFGVASPRLPLQLRHLVHRNQGHSLHIRRKPDDVPQLEAWLEKNFPRGIRGTPLDAPEAGCEASGGHGRRPPRRKSGCADC